MRDSKQIPRTVVFILAYIWRASLGIAMAAVAVMLAYALAKITGHPIPGDGYRRAAETVWAYAGVIGLVSVLSARLIYWAWGL